MKMKPIIGAPKGTEIMLGRHDGNKWVWITKGHYHHGRGDEQGYWTTTWTNAPRAIVTIFPTHWHDLPEIN